MNREGSWLCPTEIDRARVVDNSRRVRSARLFGAAMIGLALIVLVPYLGGWPLVFLAVCGVNLIALDRVMARISRPELAVAATLILTELMIAGAVAVTGAGTSPLVPWLAVPIGMSAARFRLRVVIAGVGIGLLVMAGCTLLVDPASVIDSPELSIVTVALIGNVVAIAAALQNAELHHRSESVLDQLTGLLNRKALDSRVAELAEQAGISGAPVSLIAIDIDGFKAVNDTHGHVRGDAALRDVAYQMRKATRNFELIYRFGGEEFVVVLPGLESEQASGVAERLRAAVEQNASADLELTISVGVATARGEAVELGSLFERADAALYRAKQNGRNQVAVDPRTAGDDAATDQLPAHLPAVDARLAGAIG